MLLTGFPCTCIMPEQFGVRRSHNLTELSRLPDMNVSSVGLISKLITRLEWPVKYRINCKKS